MRRTYSTTESLSRKVFRLPRWLKSGLLAKRWALVGALLLVSGLVYALFGSPGEDLARLQRLDAATLRSTILSFGAWAPLASVGLMVAHTFLPFPLEVLAAANGYVFGASFGILVTWVGMVFSSLLGYGSARIARPLVLRLVPEGRMVRLEGWVTHSSGLKLAAVRLVPVFSFNLLNLGFGLLRVPFWRFAWSTAVGIVPNVVVAVLAGQLLILGPGAWAIAGVIIAVALGAYYFYVRRW